MDISFVKRLIHKLCSISFLQRLSHVLPVKTVVKHSLYLYCITCFLVALLLFIRHDALIYVFAAVKTLRAYTIKAFCLIHYMCLLISIIFHYLLILEYPATFLLINWKRTQYVIGIFIVKSDSMLKLC